MNVFIANTGYHVVHCKENGKKTMRTLHSLILDTFGDGKQKQCCDHKNRIKTDNRLENLRGSTYSENSQNRTKQKTYRKNPVTSQYIGVYFSKNRRAKNKYSSQIAKDHKNHFIGWFLTELEAAKAYNKKALELYGSDAHINKFP